MTRLRKLWESVTGRRAAAGALLVGAVLSVGLACAGADGAFALMKRNAAVGGVVAAVAVLCLSLIHI